MSDRNDYRNLSMRIPLTWLDRADELTPRLELARPPEMALLGAISRSDVLRLALARGLAELERESALQDSLR
jgi:hypothetical protein